ncbi:uncharacterized protein EKO05_0004380 [Ascochyta rabiei]|uniref:Uncharacterized protein n=1 Tax=Didymella rabiei TaxID=5454 RepID=A0A162XSL3_DIDRA|nr:uncharacterized protein EKO05_0004380 [Ascochyta rabiei]KZM19666.1 hypothetical protein ST47_g8959 [Ascochyta rabiei]UPX13884.1 hypothetical protein EKO05_0004380 [Ascochyta rabiei]
MASSAMAYDATRSPPLSRKTSPFKDPRPPPCTPAKTAKAWDEYEKQARQNARRRDRASQSSQIQRNSASSDVGKGSKSSSSTARSSYDFKFRKVLIPASTEVATCKSCKQSITYTSGVCDRCKKIIILPSTTGESTPPLSPAARNFASTDLHLLEKKTSLEEASSRSPSSKHRGCPPALELTNPPIRLDSLRPPPTTQDLMEANRSRKASLTDPNEPFLRLQYAHQYAPHACSIPTTPTYPPTSPPSTIPSRVSTRPSSFAQMTSPLIQNAIIPSYTRHNSATPSELSQLRHYTSVSMAATSPPSLHRVSNTLQNTTSAWDDWDSDGEERVRLVGYWKRCGKDKTAPASSAKGKEKEHERERADSKVSVSSSEERRSHEKLDKKKSSFDRRSEKKQSKECSRSQSRMGKHDEAKASSASTEREEYKKHKKRPSGFIRAISCGC